MKITNKKIYDLICDMISQLMTFQCLIDEHIEMGKGILTTEVNVDFLKDESNKITEEINFLCELINKYDNKTCSKGDN